MQHTKVQALRKLIKSRKTRKAQKLIKAICGLSRFQIMTLLSAEPAGLNVTQIAQVMDSSLSKISHQLNILRKYDLVKGYGQNREKIYKLADSGTKRLNPFGSTSRLGKV